MYLIRAPACASRCETTCFSSVSSCVAGHIELHQSIFKWQQFEDVSLSQVAFGNRALAQAARVGDRQLDRIAQLQTRFREFRR